MSIAANLNDALKNLKSFISNLQIGKTRKNHYTCGGLISISNQQKGEWYLVTHLLS
jgi:hypothetical protein